MSDQAAHGSVERVPYWRQVPANAEPAPTLTLAILNQMRERLMNDAGSAVRLMIDEAEVPQDVWRTLQARFLPGSESRHVGIENIPASVAEHLNHVAAYTTDGLDGRQRVGFDLARGEDQSVTWDMGMLMSRAKADHRPYATQVLQHPKAFDFSGVLTYTRSHGSIASNGDGLFRPRVRQFEEELMDRPGERWLRAVDWVAPEINQEPLKEVPDTEENVGPGCRVVTVDSY